MRNVNRVMAPRHLSELCAPAVVSCSIAGEFIKKKLTAETQ